MQSYTALIRTHMEYCSSLFTSAAKTHLKKLDTIQCIAARIIYEVPRDTHAEPLLIFLQLDHLGDRREQHMLRLVKSSVSGSSHPAMTLLFHQEPHEAVSVPHETRYDYKRMNVNGAREALRLVEWDNELNGTANENWDRLKEILFKIQREYVLNCLCK